MTDFEQKNPVHVIRLRGPAWLIYEQDGQKEKVRIKTPCEVAPPVGTDSCVQRSFGSPTGITADQRLELVLSGFQNLKAIELNEQSILEANGDTAKEICIDVTELLKSYNRIDIKFSTPGHFGDLELRIFDAE